MKISIIIPFLNEEKYIKKCTDALLHQTTSRNQYEVIFINNGSTDNTHKILQQYHGITILHEPRINSYAARNLGIQKASNNIIAFVDADTQVAPNWVEKILNVFQTTSADLVLGKSTFPKNGYFYRFLEEYENQLSQTCLNTSSKKYLFAHTRNFYRSKGSFSSNWAVW